MKAILSVLVCLAAFPTAADAGMAKVINDDAYFPEGPVWYQSKLFYVEYGRQTIMTWDGKENGEFWRQDGCGPSAVVPLPTGEFLVTCYDSGTIARVSADGKTELNYDKDKDGHTFVGPNDLAEDSTGGVYFTASGPWESAPIRGNIFYIDKNGTIKLVADDLHAVNGVALSNDGKTLYCTETEAFRVIKFVVNPDATLTDRQLFVILDDLIPNTGHMYPDGVKIDSKGDIYIGQSARATEPLRPIIVVDPDGKLLRTIGVPSPSVPNLALAPDEKMIYVMAVDQLDEAPWHGKVYEVPNE